MVSFLSHNGLSYYDHESKDRTLPYNSLNPNNLDLVAGPRHTVGHSTKSFFFFFPTKSWLKFCWNPWWSIYPSSFQGCWRDKCGKYVRGAFWKTRDETISSRDYYFQLKVHQAHLPWLFIYSLKLLAKQKSACSIRSHVLHLGSIEANM